MPEAVVRQISEAPSVEVFEVELHRMSPRRNIPAGMNPLVIMAVAHSLRNGGNGGYGPCRTEPIKVIPDGDDRYVITDGRHRWTAHWIAGVPTARCVLDVS